VVTGSSLTAHGSRWLTSHSTAALNSTFSTSRTVLTVFGELKWQRAFSRCTSSVLIASSLPSRRQSEMVRPEPSRVAEEA